jgi:hypothetical protein
MVMEVMEKSWNFKWEVYEPCFQHTYPLPQRMRLWVVSVIDKVPIQLEACSHTLANMTDECFV